MPTKVRLQFEDFRPLKKGEGGYSPTRRLYISPSTGEVITKYRFQKEAVRVEVQPKRKHIISTASKQANYRDKLKRYVDVVNEKEKSVGGTNFITLNDARKDALFKMYYKDLKTKDNSKNGKKARALVAFGLRDEEAEYDVGDTP